MKMKFFATILVIAMLIGCLPMQAIAAGRAKNSNTLAENAVTGDDVIVYDGNTIEPFASRTKVEIGAQYGKAHIAGDTYINGDESTYYTQMPSLTAPYAPGAITDDTVTVMNAMTEYYRWLVGAPPMYEPAGTDEDLQYGALVRNWDFAHGVSSENKPADMDQETWDRGANAYHNIIAKGASPRDSITAWMDEGYNTISNTWNFIGHRQAIISSCFIGIDYGYSGGLAIGRLRNYWDTNPSKDIAITAYPPPGYTPVNDLDTRFSAWSVELNPDYLEAPDLDKITIVVTNVNTGSSYECTKANGKFDGASKASRLPPLVFVQPPCENYNYADGESYHVEITGLKDVKTGKDAKVVYTVNFFDVREYAESYATGAYPNGWCKLIINKENSSVETLQKLTNMLPHKVVVTTDTGRSVYAALKGEWELDTEHSCWRNSVDTCTLPSNVTDKANVLSKITFPYEVADYTGSFTSTGQPVAGSETTLKLWRYMLGTDRIEVYHVDSKGNNTMPYNTDSPNFQLDENGYYTWSHTWQTEDSGIWCGVVSTTNGSRDAYLAGIYEADITSGPNVTSVSVPDGWNKLILTDANMNQATLEKLGRILPRQLVVQTETKTPFTVDVTGEWTLDMENQCWRNTIDASSISVPYMDKDGLLKNIKISYEQSGVNYTGNFVQTGGTPEPGNSGRFALWRYLPWAAHIDLYQVDNAGNATVRYDENSSNLVAEGNWSNWECTWEPKDTGTWFGIYYCDNADFNANDAYLAGAVNMSVVCNHANTHEVRVEPTCAKEGSVSTVCDDCGSTLSTTPIAKLAHTWNDGEVTTPATCVNTGIMTYTCTVCGETKTEEIPTTDHTVVTDAAVAPTCTEAGLTAGSHCAICGEIIIKQEPVAPLGHAWNEVEVTKPATCLETGIMTYTCTACGETKTEVIPTTDHTIVTDAAVAPTCTEAGLTAGSHCGVCGKIIVAQEVVPARGHSWDNGKVVVDKETGKKYTVYTCRNCDATDTVEFAAYTISWGSSTTSTGVGSIQVMVNGKVITSGTRLPEGTEVTITLVPDASSTIGAWSINGIRTQLVNSSCTVYMTGNKTCSVTWTESPSSMVGTDIRYTKLTEAPKDWSGDYVIVGKRGNEYYMLKASEKVTATRLSTSAATSKFTETPVQVNADTLTNVPDNYVYTCEKFGAYYTLKMKQSNNYLAYKSDSLTSYPTAGSANASWSLSFSNGSVTMRSRASFLSRLCFNPTVGLFRCYKSNTYKLYFYKAE